jgi:hypothetical protein
MRKKLLAVLIAVLVSVAVLGVAIAESYVQSSVVQVAFPYALTLRYELALNRPCSVVLEATLLMGNNPIANALIRFYLCVDCNGYNATQIGSEYTDTDGHCWFTYYTTDNLDYFQAKWITGDIGN